MALWKLAALYEYAHRRGEDAYYAGPGARRALPGRGAPGGRTGAGRRCPDAGGRLRHRSIEIATPWPVGPVNVYLIDDDPLTLIDAGQRSDEALADLEAGLAEVGRRVEDLERIVITHQHIDHSGRARASVAERSGAELCALDSLAAWMERYPASLDDEDEFATSILRAPRRDRARRRARLAPRRA